jgi:hypothetical protein
MVLINWENSNFSRQTPAMTQEEKIKNSFLYMYGQEPIANFLKECEIFIIREERRPMGKLFFHFEFTFQVPAATYKKYESQHGYFQAKLKEDLHRYHQYKSVVVYLTADWERLQRTSTEVRPVLTPWQEINSMQEDLLSQVETAGTTIAYQNVGNTARHLMRKLSDTVFIPEKHADADNKTNLGPDKVKNRLWAFVLFKIPSSSTGDTLRDYAKSLLETTDKAIGLSNTVTHALHANAFLAQSCAISTITSLQMIKLIHDLPDPV